MPAADRAGARPYASLRLRPLDVEADLTLEVEGALAHITSEPGTLVVSLPTLGAAQRFFYALPAGGRSRASVHKLDGLLRAASLTLDVRVAGRTVVRAGAGTRPSGFARLAGVKGVELSPGGLVRRRVRARPLTLAAAAAGALGLSLWKVMRRHR